MVYLLLDSWDELTDIIDFASEKDVTKFRLANPNIVLQRAEDMDDIYHLEDDLEDEW